MGHWFDSDGSIVASDDDAARFSSELDVDTMTFKITQKPGGVRFHDLCRVYMDMYMYMYSTCPCIFLWARAFVLSL